MGIRPRIMTVFGTDNYHGPVPDDLLEKQVFIPEEKWKSDIDMQFVRDYIYNYQTKEWRWFWNVLYFGREHNPGLCGLILSKNYDSDTFRLLSMLYPEFFESGWRDAPVETDEWMIEARLRSRPPSKCGGIEFQPHWMYKQGMHWLTPIHAFVANWLLKKVGIELDPTAFKWMLVWEWS